MASSPSSDSDGGDGRKMKRKKGLKVIGPRIIESERFDCEEKVEAPPVKKSRAVRRLFSDSTDANKCRNLCSETDGQQQDSAEDSGVTDGDSQPSPPCLIHGDRNHDCTVNGRTERRVLSSDDEGLSESSNETEVTPVTAEKLREIYNSAHKLYLSKKICAENSFQLDLTDYMLEILALNEFKQRNLVGRASVIEIGSKIHECRVDRVRKCTSKLAAEVTSNTVAEEASKAADESITGQVAAQPRGNKNRKRSRFIVDDEAKISTGFEDQEIKYLHRRNALKHLFFKNIDEEIEFDYLRFFVKNEEQHPLEKSDESVALGSAACFSKSVSDQEDIKGTKWLPFRLVERWDPEAYDIWGLPVNADKEANPAESTVCGSHVTRACTTDHNAVKVDVCSISDNEEHRLELNTGIDHLSQSSDEECHHHDPCDIPETGSDDERPCGHPYVAIQDVKSLDYLESVFEKYGQKKVSQSSRYGWLGPRFCHKLVSLNRKQKSKRRTGTAKYMNLKSIDFRDPRNAYKPVSPEKTRLSCETLLKWKSANTNLEKILSRRYSPTIDFEDPYEPAELMRPPSLLTFFTDSNRCTLSVSFNGHDDKPLDVHDDDEPTQLLELNCSQELSFEMESNCREIPRLQNEEMMENLEVTHQVEGEAQPYDHVVETPLAEGFDYLQFFTGAHMNQQDQPEEDELDVPEIRLRYAMKPRPVNIHALKSVIQDFLRDELQLAEKAENTSIGDTTTSLRSLVKEVMERLDPQSRENISLHLVVVALLHVIAEHKLFMVPFQDVNPLIVSRSKAWIHKENIPGISQP